MLYKDLSVFLTEIEELSRGAKVVTEELGYRVKNPLHDYNNSNNNNAPVDADTVAVNVNEPFEHS